MQCKNRPKKKYIKITLHGGNSYVEPMHLRPTALDGELDGAEIGTKWTLELIEMNEVEYESLPEFTGH